MSDSPTVLDAALDLVVFIPVGLVLTVGEEIPKLAAKGRSRLGGRIAAARMIGQFAVAQGRREIDRRLGANSPPAARAPSAATVPRSDFPAPTLVDAVPTPGRAPAETSETPFVGAEPAAFIDTEPDAFIDTAAFVDTEPDAFIGAEPAAFIDSEAAPAPLAAVAPPAVAPPGVAPPAVAPPARPASTRGGPKTAPRPPAGDTAGDVPEVTALAIPGYASLSASQVVQRLAGLSDDELEAVGAYEASSRGRRTILARVTQLQSR